ncbi:hypothetical protein B7802_28875, partial [Salmonella enterica]|nr:hypothetical protein [Salmonella enterica]
KIEYNLKNRDYILSEKLMFTLGELLGKNKAYDILFNIYNDCTRKSSLFIADELIKHPDINKILTLKELKEITNPSNYIGCSEILSKSIVEKARQFISNKEFSHEQ